MPIWIFAGGFLLTLIAGSVNAVGFLSLQHQPLSHMSGTLCVLGLEIAAHHAPLAQHALKMVLSFFLGALLSGAIIRQSTLKAGRRYGVALSVESLLLTAATIGFHHHSPWGVYLAAMACGLQNAMASSYSGAVIRTTHMTGMVTDFGIACGHILRGQNVEWRRFRLYAVLLAGFVLGSYAGALSFQRYGYDTLLCPAILAGSVGTGYTIFKHWQRTRASLAVPGATVQKAPALIPVRTLGQSLGRRRVPYEP